MRKFIDERNPEQIIAEEELRQEYTETETKLTFSQYAEMCLSRNGGTLMEVKKEFNGVGVQHISFSGSALNDLVDARMYADFKGDKKILEAVYFNSGNDKDIKQYPFTKTGASKCVREIAEFIRNKEETI